MNLQSITEYFNFLEMEDAWIIQVFLVVLASTVLNFFQKRVIVRIHRKFEKTSNRWDDLLVISVKKPLSLLIWLLGLTFAAEIVQQESGAAIFEAVDPIRDVGYPSRVARLCIHVQVEGTHQDLGHVSKEVAL